MEQSHLTRTVPNTAACHHKIAAPIVGLTGMGTPGLQCAPLARLLTKLWTHVMESAMMKPMLPKLTLLAPSAATQNTAPMMKVGIGAGSFVSGRSPAASVAT